jgi:hypothetical protein
MNEDALTEYITSTFAGLQVGAAEGVTFFAYNPDGAPQASVYFATIKTRDDANDDLSDLARPSVYRLNLGLTEPAYRALFGPPPPRPGDDGLIETHHDFKQLDQLLPHPVYAYLGWICVLNPSAATFATLGPLLADAYALAQARYAAAPALQP